MIKCYELRIKTNKLILSHNGEVTLYPQTDQTVIPTHHFYKHPVKKKKKFTEYKSLVQNNFLGIGCLDVYVFKLC